MFYAQNIKTSKILFCTKNKIECIEEAFKMCVGNKHRFWVGIIPLTKEKFTLINKINWLEKQDIIIFELYKI